VIDYSCLSWDREIDALFSTICANSFFVVRDFAKALDSYTLLTFSSLTNT